MNYRKCCIYAQQMYMELNRYISETMTNIHQKMEVWTSFIVEAVF